MRNGFPTVVFMAALAMALSGCGSGGSDPVAPSSPPEVTPPMTTQSQQAPTSAEEPGPDVATSVPVSPSLEPVTIVGCQLGYNAVETTWSDGSVTGYTDFCQGVRDEFLQSQEVPEAGPTEYTCESGLACGITEADGVVCDQNGCRSTRVG